jgi:F-type H+-transporting ATPase subunit b
MESLIIFASIGSDLADAGRDVAKTFGWNAPHFIAQVVSFCIVAFLLHKFAYKRILGVLEERRQKIAEGLANADKIKKELASTEIARKEILDRANTEAIKLIEEARAAAARVQEQETQKAVKAAEDIIAKAHEAATADHARMLAELKREVGKLVVDTTVKVTGKVLTPEDQQRLAEQTNRELAA